MTRIGFLLSAVLSLAIGHVRPAQAKTIRRTVDVLVIGGTTSGTSAAIAAARQGAATLIVEPTPMLGGMFSAQGVPAADGNHHLPSGLWNEFREALRAHYGGAEALATGWVSNTLFEPHVADSIFRAMAAAEPRLEVLHGYVLDKVYKRGNCVTGARFSRSGGDRLEVSARITVDATDLGDALPMSGTPYRIGMDARADTGEALAPAEANDIVQDLTFVAILKDYGKGSDKTIPRPEGYDPAEFAAACQTAAGQPIPAEAMLNYGRLPNGKYMLNWPVNGNDVYMNIVEVPYARRDAALRPAREKTLRFIYYIQHELGFSHLGIADDEFGTADGLAYLPYHREGRRLDGVIRLTLPPLRERLCDIGPLADYFIEHYNRKLHRRVRGLSERALRLLRGYAWPGNVRELKNAIEGAVAVARGERLTVEDMEEILAGRLGGLNRPPELPEALRLEESFSLTRALDSYERELLSRAMQQAGSISQAARLLGLSRQNLKYKLKKFDL